MNIFPAQSQEQIEKIFDPSEQDWKGKTLGQLGYVSESSVSIGGEIFFTAYNEQTKRDIWKTDIEQTELFVDLEANSDPNIRGSYGDWLIYSELENQSICQFKAINIMTKQEVDLVTGAECFTDRFTNFYIAGNYLAVVVNNEVYYQDLSILPNISIKKNVINDDGVVIIGNVGQDKLILKDKINVFSIAPNYILDLTTGKVLELNSFLNKGIHDLSPFVEYNGRFYFQVTTEPYVERLLMSCDTAFTSGSVINHRNIMSNLLFIDKDKAYFSDYNKSNNNLGIYDINTFSKIDSIETELNLGVSVWGQAIKISADKYILTSGNAYVFHYDVTENKLTSLMIDSISQIFAIPWITLDSGIVIRYRDNEPKERLFYFPYSDLKPIELYIEKISRPYETKILNALPNNQLFVLSYDPLASSEYAVIDVINDQYRILKDIHTSNLGSASQCNITYVLPDHQLLISVGTEFGNVGFIFDPITKESVPLLDSNGAFITIIHEGIYSNSSLYTSGFSVGMTEFSYHGKITHADSTVYFMGNIATQKGLKLFSYNFRNKQLKSTDEIVRWDKIFNVGSEVYIIRNIDEEGNQKNREVFHLEDNQLISIYEVEQTDDCYDNEDINQYFIHNEILYFTSLGRLLSLNSRNNEINLLVDNLVNTSEGCYNDGIVYGNFLVKDDQVYFTETKAYMFYFYIAFLGFTWELEQHFWKTDGTVNGTINLAELEPYQLFDNNDIGKTYMFIEEGDLYMFSNQTSHPGRRLYRWETDQWQVLEVLVNDTLQSIVPYFNHLETMPLYSKPGNHQRVAAHWEDVSYMQEYSTLINDTIYNSTIYSFEGGSIPKLKKQRDYVSEIVNSYLTDRRGYPTTQIGDQWYFPFSYGNNIDYTYYPEIIQQNLSNNRVRNVINDNSKLRNFDHFIVKDEDLETGYFLLQEAGTYKSSVYRLNNCPLIDEPVEISQIDRKICKDESLNIQLSGLSSMNWIFIKVDGVETNYEWKKGSGDNMFLIDLDLEEGDYSIDYFLDTGCGIDSLASNTLEINGFKPVFTIAVESETSDSIYRYTCSDQTLGEYNWEAIGGNITLGEGTYSIIVDWGQNSEGEVSLVSYNGSCFSDTVKVVYSRITGIKNIESPSFKIIPNPSTGKIIVELPVNWHNATYQLLSIDGRILDSQEIQSVQTTFDLQRLSSGIYLIMLKNQDSMITQRLVLMD